jgi:hypothetical protein
MSQTVKQIPNVKFRLGNSEKELRMVSGWKNALA